MQPIIAPRAWHGARGWAYAKLVSHQNRREALGLYLTALWHGCYRPKLAVIILLQILLSDSGYRRLADGAISWLRAGLRESKAGEAKQKVLA